VRLAEEVGSPRANITSWTSAGGRSGARRGAC
jgi:hypothetical protein